MTSNTPNLNLLKKDPVTDGNDTFNIRTMLNENWDKIDAAVGEVREELQDIEIPDATLTQAGIVQLSNETNGSRENVAATEKAVSQAFQAGNERKAEVVAALVALGVPASTTETWAQLIPKMETIVRATGDATAADLLAGKKASNAGGPFTGTMPNQGAAIITPSGTGAVTIPDGAYKGAKVTQVSVPTAKVLNDTTIAGVKGTVPILTGGRNATGVAKWGDGGLAVYPEAGYQKGGPGDGEIKVSTAQLQQAEPSLQPGNIVKGASVYGVSGGAKPMAYDLDLFSGFTQQVADVIKIISENEIVGGGSSRNSLVWMDKNGTILSELTWADLQKYPRAVRDNNAIFCFHHTLGLWYIINKAGTVLTQVPTPASYSGYGVNFGAADQNYFYMLFSNTSALLHIDRNLTLVKTSPSFGSAISNLGMPRDMAVGQYGKAVNNKIYVTAENGNNYWTTGLYVYDLATNTGKFINMNLVFFLV